MVRVWGSDFSVQCFNIWCLVFRVKSLGLRIYRGKATCPGTTSLGWPPCPSLFRGEGLGFRG
jgi:hypothetical protein